MTATGRTVELIRVAAELRAHARQAGKLDVLVQEILPILAFRLRLLAFQLNNLAFMLDQAVREFEAVPDEPPFWVENRTEWIAEHEAIMEPSF